MNVDLLSQNPVYANLEPIDVVEAEGALVPIMYSPDCQYSPFSSPFVLPDPPPAIRRPVTDPDNFLVTALYRQGGDGLLQSTQCEAGVQRASAGRDAACHPPQPRPLHGLVRSFYVAGPDTRRTDLSAWLVLDSFRQYRFKTLIELAKSLPDELELMNQLAEENMKSYQVWYVPLVPSASSCLLTLTRTIFLT